VVFPEPTFTKTANAPDSCIRTPYAENKCGKHAETFIVAPKQSKILTAPIFKKRGRVEYIFVSISCDEMNQNRTKNLEKRERNLLYALT